jgi:hypothetical protein
LFGAAAIAAKALAAQRAVVVLTWLWPSHWLMLYRSMPASSRWVKPQWRLLRARNRRRSFTTHLLRLAGGAVPGPLDGLLRSLSPEFLSQAGAAPPPRLGEPLPRDAQGRTGCLSQNWRSSHPLRRPTPSATPPSHCHPATPPP